MIRWRSWLGVVLLAQLVSAPVYAQWDWTGAAPRDWTTAAPPPPPVDEGVWVELHSQGAPVRIERMLDEVAYPVCVAPAANSPQRGLSDRRRRRRPSGLAMVIAGSAFAERNDNAQFEELPVSHSDEVASKALLISGVVVGACGLVFLLTSSTTVTSSNGVTF